MGLDLVIEPVRLQIFEIGGMWLLVMPYEWPLRSTLTTSCIDPDVTPELAFPPDVVKAFCDIMLGECISPLVLHT